MSIKQEERNLEIKRLRYEEHLTLEAIGNKYGISRERVHQILGNTGFLIRGCDGLKNIKSCRMNTKQAINLAIKILIKERRRFAGQADAAKFGFDWGIEAKKTYDKHSEAIKLLSELIDKPIDKTP